MQSAFDFDNFCESDEVVLITLKQFNMLVMKFKSSEGKSVLFIKRVKSENASFIYNVFKVGGQVSFIPCSEVQVCSSLSQCCGWKVMLRKKSVMCILKVIRLGGTIGLKCEIPNQCMWIKHEFSAAIEIMVNKYCASHGVHTP